MNCNIKKNLTGLVFLILFSCDGFLDEKPQKSLLVPQSLKEVRAMLDYYNFLTNTPLLPFMMSDEWSTTNVEWENFVPWQQNSYLWRKSIFEPQERSSDYQTLHRQMFYANTALHLLENMESGNSPQNSQMRGEALTLRARVLFDLATLFLPGPQSTLKGQIKIPVNLSQDINASLIRMGIDELLGIIKEDLEEAFTILPDRAEIKTRPDKRTAKAILARIHLYEQNWDKALSAATYVVENADGLMDFKKLNSSLSYPFSVFNQETIFFQQMQTSIITIRPTTELSKALYESYQKNDLRKALFFRLSPTQGALFKGSYTGGFRLFSGIGISEMYLTAAEAAIRAGKLEEGLQRLNELGSVRYSDFKPWNSLQQQEALELAIAERNRELVFRCLRWMDMKRLKYLNPSFQASREINGTKFTLMEEDQFILDLPPYEVELGMQ